MKFQNLIGSENETSLLLVAQNATVNGKHGVISTCFKISNNVKNFCEIKLKKVTNKLRVPLEKLFKIMAAAEEAQERAEKADSQLIFVSLKNLWFLTFLCLLGCHDCHLLSSGPFPFIGSLCFLLFLLGLTQSRGKKAEEAEKLKERG